MPVLASLTLAKCVPSRAYTTIVRLTCMYLEFSLAMEFIMKFLSAFELDLDMIDSISYLTGYHHSRLRYINSNSRRAPAACYYCPA